MTTLRTMSPLSGRGSARRVLDREGLADQATVNGSCRHLRQIPAGIQARMEDSEELPAFERFSDLEGTILGHDRRPRPVESVAGRLSG